MFLPRFTRPRDLAIYCVGIVGMYLLSSLLYSEAGDKFTEWLVKEKLPGLADLKPWKFDTTQFESNFTGTDLSNLKWDNSFRQQLNSSD